MIKAVVFDIGGVLAYDVWEHLLLGEDGIASIYNLDPRKVEEVGRELWELFAYLPASDEKHSRELEREYWSLLTERLNLQIPVSELIELTDKFIRPVDGMIDLVKALKSHGVELAICSNNTAFWFERQRDKLGLDKLFEADKIILSCNIRVPKRSSDLKMFRALIDALKTRKSEAVFVDDRDGNIEKGLRAGLTGIYFPAHKKFGCRYLKKLLEKMGVTLK